MDNAKKHILLNFALCWLKTRHFDQAIHNATLALDLDPNAVKGFYNERRGVPNARQVCIGASRIGNSVSRRTHGCVITPWATDSNDEKGRVSCQEQRIRGCNVPDATQGNGSDPSEEKLSWSDVALRRALELDMRRTTKSEFHETLDMWQPSTRGLREMDALCRMHVS